MIPEETFLGTQKQFLGARIRRTAAHASQPPNVLAPVSEIFSAPLFVFLIWIARVIGSGLSSGTVEPVTSSFSHQLASLGLSQVPSSPKRSQRTPEWQTPPDVAVDMPAAAAEAAAASNVASVVSTPAEASMARIGPSALVSASCAVTAAAAALPETLTVKVTSVS